MYLYALPLHREGSVAGALVIIHDSSYIQDRLSLIWKNNFIRFLVNALVVSLTTLLLIRWSIAGPIAKMAEWMKHLRTEKNEDPLRLPRGRVFEPLTKEVTQMARSISAAREAAEEEARLRQTAESTWTPVRLKEQVRALLQERPLFVISNREPYIHERQGKKIECLVPASGLVTALEPVLKACGGTWIAHGSGDADREVVDDQSKIRVPPRNPNTRSKGSGSPRKKKEVITMDFLMKGSGRSATLRIHGLPSGRRIGGIINPLARSSLKRLWKSSRTPRSPWF